VLSRHAIPVGRILGIPIDLDPSWFLIFALLTWSLAVGYYPAEFKGWPVVEYWVVGGTTACLLYGSVLLHELGHSVVALRYRIPVRRITLFIFGGVAQIATEPPSAGAELWIALAGPVVSFALALLFHVVEPALASGSALLALAKYLAYINGALVLFNLIPGFPLDGGRIFRALVWGLTHNLRRATVIAGNVGRFIGFLFILAGVWQIFGGNLINGMWIAFVGWFLESAALAQIQLQAVHGLLAGHTVAESMTRGYPEIAGDAVLQELLDYHILREGRRSVVVKAGDGVLGLLTLHSLKQVPRAKWPTTTVAQAMIPVAQLKWVRPDMDLEAALEEMDRDGVNQLPVMASGQIVGMLTREDLVSFLRRLQPLNGGSRVSSRWESRT
jgi:Zn-dependent protease/CBS domain-containing protein